MEIIFHSQQVELTPAHRQYIEKKLSRLERYFDPIGEVQFHAAEQRSLKTAEVTLNANGKLIRAEERSHDLRTAVDLVAAKLEKQIKHFKGRMADLQRRPRTRNIDSGSAEDANPQAAGPPMIARRKRFPLERMTAEEAVDRMKFLGHDFYVFQEAESGDIGIVYERRDGGCGLLEPMVDA